MEQKKIVIDSQSREHVDSLEAKKLQLGLEVQELTNQISVLKDTAEDTAELLALQIKKDALEKRMRNMTNSKGFIENIDSEPKISLN